MKFRNVLLSPLLLNTCAAFLVQTSFSQSSWSNFLSDAESSTSMAAGRGMGMGMGGSRTKSKKSKKKPASPFDVQASITRLEKKYDDYMAEEAKILQNEFVSNDDTVVTEYIVAARSETTITDWVPFAQLGLKRTQAQVSGTSEEASKDILQAAVSLYCRELYQVASNGSREFGSIPRDQLQYSVEGVDSFHRHVYEVVLEGKNENSDDNNVMTKVEARTTLGFDLTTELERSDVRSRYREMAMKFHPDRHVGSDVSEEEKSEVTDKYSRIKLAYETLSSGVREKGKSWYESLGGRSRTEFLGPINLLAIQAAGDILTSKDISSAVIGLDPDTVQAFVARTKA